MKKTKGTKILLLLLLLGLLVGWYLTRGAAKVVTQKTNATYADLDDDFVDSAPAGEIVVDFADDIDPSHVDSYARALGVELAPLSDEVNADRIYVGHVRDGADERQVLAELRANSEVEAAEENFTYAIPESDWANSGSVERERERERPGKNFPNDPRYGEQWHLDQIHMPETWPAAQGEGVVVAVIDTGVSHTQDLKQTEFVPGWNFVANNNKSDDDHGHGTHVAGTIAQSTHNGVGVAGVAYRAKIMPLKVLSAQGSGSVAGIADAIRFAADHGAKVINMSLGGRMTSQVLGRAVKYAHDKGVVVVCAAGNDGKGKVSFPAAYPGAIAVAATQRDEHTTFYSNWGKEIDIAGPGGNTRGDAKGGVLQNTLFQGKDDYYFFMGTSMASPHVAGVAALVVGAGVTDPDAVENVLKETARKPSASSEAADDYRQHYGAGIVDAKAAVRKAQIADGAMELGAASALAAAILYLLRRRGAHFGVAGAAALVAGSSGLFFLPQLGIRFASSALIAHGLPAWDEALLGASGHGNPLFYSALVPFLVAALLVGVTRLRGLVAGLCLGVAGHLFAQLFLHTVDIRWMPFDALWLVANGLIATGLGTVAARRTA